MALLTAKNYLETRQNRKPGNGGWFKIPRGLKGGDLGKGNYAGKGKGKGQGKGKALGKGEGEEYR